MYKGSLKFELKRKAFHIVLGLTLITLILFNLIGFKTLLTITILGGITILLSKKYKLPIITSFLKHFERKEDKDRFPGKGAFLLFLGFTITVKIFPKETALAALMILTIGDPIAHLAGRTLGRTKNPLSLHKLAEGSLIAVIVAFLCALPFVHPIHALIAAFFAMLVESIEFNLHHELLDDNLLIPLVAGLTISILKAFF
jgi:dolichol kinase